MERTFDVSRDRLWALVTEPAHVRRWAPFQIDRPLHYPGPVGLAASQVPEEAQRSGKVLEVSSPHLLCFRWGADRLTWKLSEGDRGTRLRFAHQFARRDQAPAYAAGWQLCLQGLRELSQGSDAPLMVGERALEYGWLEWYVWYAQEFGLNLGE